MKITKAYIMDKIVEAWTYLMVVSIVVVFSSAILGLLVKSVRFFIAQVE